MERRIKKKDLNYSKYEIELFSTLNEKDKSKKNKVFYNISLIEFNKFIYY